jgi:hypothetical protein
LRPLNHPPKEGGSCTLTAAGTALLFFLGNESFMFVKKVMHTMAIVIPKSSAWAIGGAEM